MNMVVRRIICIGNPEDSNYAVRGVKSEEEGFDPVLVKWGKPSWNRFLM